MRALCGSWVSGLLDGANGHYQVANTGQSCVRSKLLAEPSVVRCSPVVGYCQPASKPSHLSCVWIRVATSGPGPWTRSID